MGDGVMPLRPSYGAAFKCIGSSCEDHCCGGWDIPVDRDTYERYRLFPAEKLGVLVAAFVNKSGADVPDALYAQIHRAPSGVCPFLNGEKLCGIQKEYGAELLSATCSMYPRSLSRVEGSLEASLSLSCPEAARNVLLDAGFLTNELNIEAANFRKDNVFVLAGNGPDLTQKPCGQYGAVRSLLVSVFRDRSRPVRERVLLVGEICQRLEEVGGEDQEATVVALIATFTSLLEAGELLNIVPQVVGNPRLRLDVAMKMTSERMRDSATCGRRFIDVFWNFVEGIGSEEAGAAGDDVGRFIDAEEHYWEPYLAGHCHVLENYVLNYMFQHLFPFGREGSDQFRPRTLFDEWLLMATQFMWVESLLIGVAAKCREGFGAEDVILTVQSFTRAVEHYADVLDWLLDFVTQRGLNSLEGMASLLRPLARDYPRRDALMPA